MQSLKISGCIHIGVAMEISILVEKIADLLKSFDTEKPRHKHFQAGVGPFGEPQLV
jgi:hypothetical protein